MLERFDAGQQLAAERGLDVDEVVLDFGRLDQQLFPGVAQKIDPFQILFGDRYVEFDQRVVGILKEMTLGNLFCDWIPPVR